MLTTVTVSLSQVYSMFRLCKFDQIIFDPYGYGSKVLTHRSTGWSSIGSLGRSGHWKDGPDVRQSGYVWV
jgi:hypothetical protein